MPEASVEALSQAADLETRQASRMRRVYRERLQPRQRAALERVARTAEAAGMAVYLVGGAVRDLLLRRPFEDLDLAVEGEARALARRVGGTVHTHEPFGTAALELDGVRLDLAGTRRERYPRPAALPVVARAGLAEDLARRDFTVNALAAPLASDGPRGLIDPFRGLEDLRRRRIRVLHEGSFVDDPTRALRALRLAAELRFSLEAATARLMRRDVGWLDHLSSARLRRELRRILESRSVGRGLRLMKRQGLLAALAPAGGVARLPTTAIDRLPRLLDWFRRRFPSEPLVVWCIPLAIVLRAASESQFRVALARLEPDRGTRSRLWDAGRALTTLPQALEARGVRGCASRVYAACRGHAVEALLAVLATAESPATRRAIRSYLSEWREVRADITGDELLRRGVPRGPAVARGLQAALAAKLDGRARTRRAQLAVAVEQSRRP